MSKISPTIYLLKTDVVEPLDAIKEDKRAELDQSLIGSTTIFYKKSPSNPPAWSKFVYDQFQEVPKGIFWNSSSYAVLILKVGDRYFAATLGMGVHLLDNVHIEYNFGLRVAINCVPADELRQMDLTTPEANAQKTKKQSYKKTTVDEFGVNKQKDILRGVVGTLEKDHIFGKRVQGKDSIQVGKKISDLAELSQLCDDLYKCSLKDEYTKKFSWIDNMAFVSDPPLLEVLFGLLVQAIKENKFDGMLVTLPEFIDDFHLCEGIKFKGSGRRGGVYTLPAMEDFVSSMGEEFIQTLDYRQLKKVCRLSVITDEGVGREEWGMSRCISWETVYQGKKYILSDGSWYEIADNFYKETEAFYAARVIQNPLLVNMPPTYSKEAEYNRYAFIQSAGALSLFDLGCDEAKHRKITANNEVCDLYDYKSKDFIHVKRGNSSADLSHLFRQGSYSAQVLKQDISEFNKVKEYLLEDGIEVKEGEFEPNIYKCTFVVILKNTQKKDIPFFSKLSFKDESERLIEIMGMRCFFCFVSSDV